MNVTTPLAFVDFFNPDRDTDSSPQVVQIYRQQFPDLYRAADRGELITATGSAIQLGGDTLITYRSAIRKIFGRNFRNLDEPTQGDILSALESYATTREKQIQFWDGSVVINRLYSRNSGMRKSTH